MVCFKTADVELIILYTSLSIWCIPAFWPLRRTSITRTFPPCSTNNMLGGKRTCCLLCKDADLFLFPTFANQGELYRYPLSNNLQYQLKKVPTTKMFFSMCITSRLWRNNKVFQYSKKMLFFFGIFSFSLPLSWSLSKLHLLKGIALLKNLISRPNLRWSPGLGLTIESISLTTPRVVATSESAMSHVTFFTPVL